MKTLIVDDNTHDVALLKSVAVPLGFVVQACKTYEAGVRKGVTEHFDAIFIGMDSPTFDGVDLISPIRKSDSNGNTVIAMLAATEDISGLRRAIGEGADLFLTKPVSGERLGRMLSAFPEWKDRRHGARFPLVTDVISTWDGQQFSGNSLNISETGMLLRSQAMGSFGVGAEVKLEFRIREIHSWLNLTARVVRKDGTDRFGVAFGSLSPEDVNAINVYIVGQMKPCARPAFDYLESIRRRRLSHT